MSYTKEQLKHTPGPWEVSIGNEGSIFGDLNNDAHNGDHPYIGTVAGIGVDEDIPECTANAKLISVAPDMYEVVKELYEFSTSTGLRGSIFPKLEAVMNKLK